MLKIGHSITRPGLRHGDPPVEIKVPEELETVPGIVQRPGDVDFYSREDPLEDQQIDYSARSEWIKAVYDNEVPQVDTEDRRIHDRLNRPIIAAARDSGDIEPTAEPVAGRGVTEDIRLEARELGYHEVGFSRFDMRYVYKSMRSWVKFPHAICLAWEQDYEPTQSSPSWWGDRPHHAVYRTMEAVALELADYIRSLGYHAQFHNPNHKSSGTYIPMFVEAGLGQLGANGQLLSPHFRSRARIMIITTDALITYDQPIDYGIHTFCNTCQVCVNRCPGRALMREKVWWRGIEKHKLIYRRCLPVAVRYEGCAVCMKVCPIQRYGVAPVMEHYAATGQVLGKGTDLLEGYSLRDKKYYGPGELPSFDREFFNMPPGKSEDRLFVDLKKKISAGDVLADSDGDEALREFRDGVSTHLKIAAQRSARPGLDTGDI